MSDYIFKHMKAPAWCADSMNSIYFKVYWLDCNREKHEIGYIGCQENDFGRGLVNNFCYKTFEDWRNKGLTKRYIKEFVDTMLDVDCIRAKVPRDNIASQKVLEYAGFEKRGIRHDEDGEPTKFGYTWKRF